MDFLFSKKSNALTGVDIEIFQKSWRFEKEYFEIHINTHDINVYTQNFNKHT